MEFEDDCAVLGVPRDATVVVDLEDVFRGVTRTIEPGVPNIDAQWRRPVADRTLNSRISRGLRDGQSTRLAGQGAPGYGADRAVDLLLDIRVVPAPATSRRSRALHGSMARELAFDPRAEAKQS